MSSMLVLGSVRFVLAFTAAPRLPVAAKPAPAAPVPCVEKAFVLGTGSVVGRLRRVH